MRTKEEIEEKIKALNARAPIIGFLPIELATDVEKMLVGSEWALKWALEEV